ncbi:hypothetical protein Esti_002034 [Eimeria stiedai]
MQGFLRALRIGGVGPRALGRRPYTRSSSSCAAAALQQQQQQQQQQILNSRARRLLLRQTMKKCTEQQEERHRRQGQQRAAAAAANAGEPAPHASDVEALAAAFSTAKGAGAAAAAAAAARIGALRQQHARLTKRRAAPLPRSHWDFVGRGETEPVSCVAAAAAAAAAGGSFAAVGDSYANAVAAAAAGTAEGSIFEGDPGGPIEAAAAAAGVSAAAAAATGPARFVSKATKSKKKAFWELPDVRAKGDASSETSPSTVLRLSPPAAADAAAAERAAASDSKEQQQQRQQQEQQQQEVFEWPQGSPTHAAASRGTSDSDKHQERWQQQQQRQRALDFWANRAAADVAVCMPPGARSRVEPSRLMKHAIRDVPTPQQQQQQQHQQLGGAAVGLENGEKPLAAARAVIPSQLATQSSTSSSSGGGEILDSGARLVRQLKQQALQYAAAGVDPSLLHLWEEVGGYYPGIERQRRQQELAAAAELSLQQLLLQNRCSSENVAALIRAKGQQQGLAAAVQVYEEAAAAAGLTPEAEWFVSLLLAAAKERDAAAARLLFLKMRALLLPPTPRVYAALVQAHAAAGDTAAAAALVRKLEADGLDPDCVVYTVLLDSLVKRGDSGSALRLFRDVRTWKGIKPDAVMFTVLIKLHAKRGETEKALNLLDDMRASGVHPTDVTYTELIRACSKSPSFFRTAFDFYNQMLAEGMPITNQACATVGSVHSARGLVEDMHRRGLSLSVAAYNSLIYLFAAACRLPKVDDQERSNNVRYAWHVLQCMRESHIQPQTKTLNAIIQVYVHAGFAQYAVDTLKHFKDFGLAPNAETYAILLRMFAKDLKEPGRFFALWDFLKKSANEHKSAVRSPSLLRLALSTAIDSQSSAKTLEVLRDMYALRVYPTPQLASRLVEAGRHVREIHELMHSFVRLQQHEVYGRSRREQQLLQTQVDAHELEVFRQGSPNVRSNETEEQRARKHHFRKKDRNAQSRWVPLGHFLQNKEKGGEAYAKRHDRPTPNLVEP